MALVKGSQTYEYLRITARQRKCFEQNEQARHSLHSRLTAETMHSESTQGFSWQPRDQLQSNAVLEGCAAGSGVRHSHVGETLTHNINFLI